MRNTFKLLGIIALVTVIWFSFAACGDGGDSSNNGESGSIYAGRDGLSPRFLINRSEIPEDELAKFSIQIDYLVGRSTISNYMGWGILDYDNRENQIIPIISQLRLGNLDSLKPTDSLNFCDYIGFDIQLLYDGTYIANFPEAMFIKDEEFAFYQNPGNAENEDSMVLRDGWRNFREIFNKYPMVPDLDWDQSDGAALWDDFVVIPFSGIDLTQNFDLKFEWDISILVTALNDAYNSGGGYSAVQNRESDFFRDFFSSFSLEVLY